jgi:hypothetical protein
LLRKAAESKLEQLQGEQSEVESELEEVRVEASSLGGQGREIYQKGVDLAAALQILRRKTEQTEAAEHLQKKAWEGLRHISEMLGESVVDDTAPITDVVRDIDAMLELLLEEKEKERDKLDTMSISQDSGNQSRVGTGKDGVIIIFLTLRSFGGVVHIPYLYRTRNHLHYIVPVSWRMFLTGWRARKPVFLPHCLHDESTANLVLLGIKKV